MKPISAFLFAWFFVLVFSGCTRSDEDLKTGQIARSWKLSKLMVNDQDKTAEFQLDFPNYQINFASENTYSESFLVAGAPFSINGQWEFKEKATIVELEDNNSGKRIWQIEDLSSARLTVFEEATGEKRFFIPR